MLSCVHVEELVGDNFKEFIGLSPFADAGIYAASLGRRDSRSQVIFAQLQTVWNKAAEIGHIDVMIIDEVPAWDPSVRSSKRLVTTPKRHLGDPSLAAALLQMSPDRMLMDLETTGFLFESLVAHDLRIYGNASDADCFHYREAEGRLEVDYILENRDGDWIGVEVKLGQGEVEKAATSLRRLTSRVARAPKALVVVTGSFDMIARFRIRDHAHLQALLLDRIWPIRGLQRIETFLGLGEIVRERGVRELMEGSVTIDPSLDDE